MLLLFDNILILNPFSILNYNTLSLLGALISMVGIS